MNRIFLFLFVSFLGGRAIAGPLNQSSVRFSDVSPKSGAPVLGICASSSPASVPLVGIDSRKMESGVPCLAGDYDGNGFTDFAFFQSLGADDYKVTVLFYEGKKVKEQSLLNANGQMFGLLPHNEATKKDGFFADRRGKENVETYFYDVKTKKWNDKGKLFDGDPVQK
jgi:hypothetical protein